MAKRSRCACGKVKSKYSNECNACYKKADEKRKAENQAILKSGTCPQCGSGLRRNLALTGWVQCEQYGAPDRRARPNGPSCSFQCFV